MWSARLPAGRILLFFQETIYGDQSRPECFLARRIVGEMYLEIGEHLRQDPLVDHLIDRLAKVVAALCLNWSMTLLYFSWRCNMIVSYPNWRPKMCSIRAAEHFPEGDSVYLLPGQRSYKSFSRIYMVLL